jgi:tetratricopeptide (TPR) repeat protein
MKKHILIITLFALPLICWTQKADLKTLNGLVIKYEKEGNYPKAIEYSLQALDAAEKKYGKEHKNYIIWLNNLAVLYGDMGNYEKAEPLYIEALAIRKKTLGEDHPEYAASLSNLAMLYTYMGNFAKAEPLNIEALTIQKKVLGKNHPDYAASIINLALLYSKMGNYEKAEALYIEALAIRKKVLGKEHFYVAASLNNLAMLYFKMGNYEKAEPLYIEARDIAKKVLGEKSPYNATLLNNLALLYENMGNYEKAEKQYIEVIDILKRALGENNAEYATSLNNLGGLYIKMGNYTKAEPLLIEALAIRKKALGENHSDYAASLNNLAMLYYKMSSYAKAEALYIEAKDINKRVLGESHPDYAVSLNNLAELNFKIGNYAKAEPLNIEALAIRKKALGENHPDYASSLNNLALLYTNMGNYAKAEPLYIEALTIKKKALGENHPDYATSLNNLAVLYDNTGNYAKAEPLYTEANNNINNQIRQNFGFMSETEKEQFVSNIEFNFKGYNSFALHYKSQKPEFVSLNYNNELAHKGMLLLSNNALRKSVYDSNDSTLINIYDRFINTHKTLSKLYVKPIADRKMNIDSLENIAGNLEKALTIKGKNLPGFENLAGLANTKWQDVQLALKTDEAAIEFVNFQYYDKRWTDSTFYCALILRKEYKYPKMIYLFEEKQLQEIISTPKATNNATYITQLYSNGSNRPSLNSLADSRNQLYRLTWQPFDSLLKGIETIYLAPSGLLNKVAFNAIPVSDSIYLSDKYNISLLGSTRVLTQANKSELTSGVNLKAVFYGGIEYDVDKTEMIASARNYQKPQNDLLAGRSVNIPENTRGTTWAYLPGTLTEISNIEKLFKPKQISTTQYTGKQATEESFKHLSDNGGSPELIHIATHGFFFPEIKTEKAETGKVDFRGSNASGILNGSAFTHVENPLLRSGIILAGASHTWQNEPVIEGVEDGTLTAYEVSNINLYNTQLVVLSACETGLGDVKGSEGVFGLQRAFKMAGVRYIIMSLWQVPDYQTSELMTFFYTNFLNGMSIKNAFNTAQQTMRKKYDPFYWAAFVIIE